MPPKGIHKPATIEDPMRRSASFSVLLLFLPAVLSLCVSCTPMQRGATDSAFYSSGRLNMNITVNPPLTLAATGKESASVPSDVNLSPFATLTYAVFAEGSEGPVTRHAHTFICTLPENGWRWSMETWPSKSTLELKKLRAGGKFWTVQIRPVESDKDWFSMLWTGNGREVPESWLAKRWSATPFIEARIVAEYREPAPQCVRTALADVQTDSRGQPQPPDGKNIMDLCRGEVEAFSRRADTVFLLERMEGDAPSSPMLKQLARPGVPPNLKALAGEAEILSRDGGYNPN